VIKKSKWLFSVSGNCLVMVMTSLLAWGLATLGRHPLTLTGAVDPGLPAWQLPWHFNRNATATPEEEWEGPFELAQDFGLGLIMLPLVAILQNMAIVKVYAGDRPIAASQEILALGVSQAVGAFTGSLPVCAAFSRSLSSTPPFHFRVVPGAL
jgi:sodium-independent sulfate anion transporter 11